MDQELSSHLSLEEFKALRETDEWCEAEATKLKKALGFVKKPVDYLYSKVPEGIREKVAEAILKVLNSVHEGSSSLVSVDKVYTRLEKHTGVLGDSPDFFRLKVSDLDRAAVEIVSSAKNKCTAEGAATGVAGLPGIVVDVPVLYGLLFHAIQEIAISYGYSVTSEAEYAFIFKVLEIGHMSEREARRQGMKELEGLQQKVSREGAARDVETLAIKHGLQALARRLARTLIQRKVSQSVVLVGGVIGAGVNRQLASEVGAAAHHAYRRRFLYDLAKERRAGRVEGPKSTRQKTEAPKPPKKSRLPAPPSYD